MLIAPCGISCRTCYVFQRAKAPCPGCYGDDAQKPKHCRQCAIAACAATRNGSTGTCADCEKPCRRLKEMDRRYRRQYGEALLDTLAYLKAHGMQALQAREATRWTCPACGETLCVHASECPACKTPRSENLPLPLDK